MSLTAREWGEGEPVVLVHGIPGGARVWTGVAERLAADFRVIAPDLLGFGGSRPARAADELWADSQARALASLLDGLGVERATLVGHDFGGPVALALTELRPELATRLVLCATNAFPDVPIPLPIRAVTWPVVGDAAARLLLSGPSLRMMAPAELVSDVDSVRTIFTTALREIEARYAPIERALRAVRCPALVVWAEDDPFFDVDQGRRTAGALPGARLLLYGGCGHYVPVERPERLASDIAAFTRDPVAA